MREGRSKDESFTPCLTAWTLHQSRKPISFLPFFFLSVFLPFVYCSTFGCVFSLRKLITTYQLCIFLNHNMFLFNFSYFLYLSYLLFFYIYISSFYSVPILCLSLSLLFGNWVGEFFSRLGLHWLLGWNESHYHHFQAPPIAIWTSQRICNGKKSRETPFALSFLTSAKFGKNWNASVISGTASRCFELGWKVFRRAFWKSVVYESLGIFISFLDRPYLLNLNVCSILPYIFGFLRVFLLCLCVCSSVCLSVSFLFSIWRGRTCSSRHRQSEQQLKRNAERKRPYLIMWERRERSKAKK